jgi:8-oxo-dGTP pyrophosphatase MutT (NUDIX family)
MELQVGIKAFSLNEKGQFLLLEKNTEGRPEHKGRWDIPGGRINPGSSLMENLAREIFEETGLDIDLSYPPKLLRAEDIINPSTHTIRLTYWVHVKGTVELGDEHLSYQWVNLPELKEIMENENSVLADAIKSGMLDEIE